MLDPVPDAHVRRTQDGWEASWMPPRWGVMLGIAAPFITGLLMSSWVMPIFAAAYYVAVLPLLVRMSTRTELRTARWDESNLEITVHGKLYTWAWSAIDSIRLERAAFVIEVDGELHKIPGPATHAGTRRLLEHFKARLEQRTVSLPTESFKWNPVQAGMTAAVRIRSGEPTRTRYQRASALGIAAILAGTHLTAGVTFVIASLLAFTGHEWAVLASHLPSAAFYFGVFVSMMVVTAAVVNWGGGARRGTILVDAHRLTIQAVQRQPLAMLWEDIESIDGDDQTLRILVNGRLATFDLSAEPPAKVRGLVEELQRRRMRVEFASDLPGEAEQRRQQVLNLVGQRK